MVPGAFDRFQMLPHYGRYTIPTEPAKYGVDTAQSVRVRGREREGRMNGRKSDHKCIFTYTVI